MKIVVSFRHEQAESTVCVNRPIQTEAVRKEVETFARKRTVRQVNE
jgi:hypothetical protein